MNSRLLKIPSALLQLFVSSLILFAFAAKSAFADNSVTITPGSTVTIQPSQNPTIVTCTIDTSVMEKFCVCIDPGRPFMKRLNRVYVLSNGTKNEVYVGDFDSMADCEAARAKAAICGE
jgi:hypothetical protein